MSHVTKKIPRKGTMIIGVNTLLKYLGFFHGMCIIMLLNIVATGIFPILTTLFGYHGALIARLGLIYTVYRIFGAKLPTFSLYSHVVSR